MDAIFQKAVNAGRELNLVDKNKIDTVLLKIAGEAQAHSEAILAANKLDLARMNPSNPMYDRLMLTPERITAIAADIRNVASLVSPVGEVLSETVRPNGMKITKVRVPFGVVGVIYEARPNVSFDVFSLCFKSKNVALLKGGTDAYESNKAIVGLIRNVLQQERLNPDMVTLLPPDRSATDKLLAAVDYVDVLIPRGSKSLINYVRDNAKVPVIETGAGICHTYFDAKGDTAKGAAIVFNAKTRRVSVCNALDCLLIHSSRLSDLPALAEKLATKNVVIYADNRSYNALAGIYPASLLEKATDDSYGTEFLDYKISVKTVDSLTDAVAHVQQYSSKHSEAIITEDNEAAALYTQMVDAACVYTNVSTAFTDGAQFGLGAEIGISTQKLHARGPMALAELTSYKYIITGDRQTRE